MKPVISERKANITLRGGARVLVAADPAVHAHAVRLLGEYLPEAALITEASAQPLSVISSAAARKAELIVILLDDCAQAPPGVFPGAFPANLAEGGSSCGPLRRTACRLWSWQAEESAASSTA